MKLIPGNMMQVLALHINANTLFFPSLLPSCLPLSPSLPPSAAGWNFPSEQCKLPLGDVDLLRDRPVQNS